ncbi:hypothetical protein CFP56_024563 [Quercus suber]|uniref:Uncharacterized protein n=1 Tax=Quercus suber TaxID=58331 RepID=A0AAW0K9W9_QUESU
MHCHAHSLSTGKDSRNQRHRSLRWSQICKTQDSGLHHLCHTPPHVACTLTVDPYAVTVTYGTSHYLFPAPIPTTVA